MMIATTINAQAPQLMSFQSVVRESTGKLVTNKSVGLRLSILQGSLTGTAAYVETQTATSNANGLVTLQVGGGTVVSGKFSSIDWSAGPYYVKSEIDPNGGANYLVAGTTQLLSVAYALYAAKSGTPGPQGIQGLTGSTGATGATGATGPQGLQGIQGVAGTNGTAGKDGVSITASKVIGDSLYVTLSSGQTLNAGNVKGVAGTNGNTVLNGTITPTTLIGANGDFYINTTTNTIYGPKTSSGWGVGTLLTGNNGSSSGVLPSVITSASSLIGYSACTVSANVTSTGGQYLFGKGVCISTVDSPTINNTYINAVTNSIGAFTVQFNNLLPNTTYKIRAFATSMVGTAYGVQLSVTTPPLALTSTFTDSIINISTNSALANGHVTDSGGTTITDKGICWAKTINPTLANSFVSGGNGLGIFNGLMTGLTQGTTYYVRAYATNTTGTAYGKQLVFTTNAIPLASVTTTAASSVAYTSATVGGNVTNDGGTPVTARGVCWAVTSNPTTANSVDTLGIGVGTYSASITGLQPNVTYYFRAYAINSGGTVYGTQATFTTVALTTPTVSTNSVIGISTTNATSGGNITDDGGSTVTTRGVCYSTNPNPTIANSIVNSGTGLGIFNSNLSSLSLSTTYYLRAFATNTQGTAYGTQQTFTTLSTMPSTPNAPTVGTGITVLDSIHSGTGGGYVSMDGGATVTERGFCWATTANPTIANSHANDGIGGLGYYNSRFNNITGCNTFYYVRSYAINSNGVGYGGYDSLKSGSFTSLVTKPITLTSATTAISGGDSIVTGDCSVTAKGVCWSLAHNPTTSSSKTNDGTGFGSFNSTITGLTSNITYYVRAYVTNLTGTKYGAEKVLTPASTGYYVGQSYGGGIIFYVDSTGQHGLIAAPSDQGVSVQWGGSSSGISTSTAIGTGATNTASIIASITTAGIAAKLCDDLVLNGYSDWFLPSKDELYIMYTGLQQLGLGSFTKTGYWSSSAYPTISGWAWYQDFSTGSQFDTPSSTRYYVRAIRKF